MRVLDKVLQMAVWGVVADWNRRVFFFPSYIDTMSRWRWCALREFYVVLVTVPWLTYNNWDVTEWDVENVTETVVTELRTYSSPVSTEGGRELRASFSFLHSIQVTRRRGGKENRSSETDFKLGFGLKTERERERKKALSHSLFSFVPQSSNKSSFGFLLLHF